MECEEDSFSSFAVFDRLVDIAPSVHTEVLLADSRLDQLRVRVAVDNVFAAHPALGKNFEPSFNGWMSRSYGGWTWGVDPPGVAVADVIARQRACFDIRTGRLFAVSMLPGAPDRLVLTASQLCMNGPAWQVVVEDMVAAYPDSGLRPEAQDAFD